MRFKAVHSKNTCCGNKPMMETRKHMETYYY